MPPSLRKDRKLTDKGKAFATESGDMPPRVDDSGGVDGDRGSSGQSRPPPEEDDRNQAFESDNDRTIHPENDNVDVRDDLLRQIRYVDALVAREIMPLAV